MRIISGKYKGKRLLAPKKLPVRPTTDMAKEGLFNILTHRFFFEDLSVMELFAGTGNISFEFASRGVTDIRAVDANAGCIKYISKISNELQMGIKTAKADAFKYLQMPQPKPVDIIFADPPYRFEVHEFDKLTTSVFDRSWLKDGGVLIIEHAIQTDLSPLEHFAESRKYGSSCFTFFSTLPSVDQF